MPIVFHPDPAKVINQSVKSTINTLEAAAKAQVQRYVLCSSSKAVETARYDGTPRRLTVNNYNTESLLKACCGPREETLEWSLDVFSAGRALAELSFWSWIGEKDPPFVANCVVPDGAFGRGLNGATSTNQMLKAALAGEWGSVPMPICEYPAILVTPVVSFRMLIICPRSLPMRCARYCPPACRCDHQVLDL